MVYTQYKNNYDFLISNLPWYLQYVPETQTMYKEISKYFDSLDDTINIISKISQINVTTGIFLDDLGALMGVERNNLSDIDYRMLIKLEFNKQNFVPNINQITELIQKLTNYNPVINVGWEVDGEPGRYDIDIVANEEFNFELINRLGLKGLVGGGIKINQRSCIENWEEAYFLDDIYVGDVLFPQFYRRNPICDFSFNDIAHMDDIYLNDINFTNDERGDLRGK